MVAVRDQRRTVDFTADADAKHRHRFIADETHYASNRDPQNIVDWLWVDQPVDRLVARKDCAEQDDGHDQHTRHILDLAEPVGETGAGLSPDQHERHPKGNGRRRITEVVDGVGQQCHTSRDCDDKELQHGCYGKQRKGPLDGPDAARGRRDVASITPWVCP